MFVIFLVLERFIDTRFFVIFLFFKENPPPLPYLPPSSPPPPPDLPVPRPQYYHRALQRGSGASVSHRALLIVDAVLPWVVTMVWIRSVPPLFLGDARAVSWGARLRVAATGGAVLVRLGVGRAQLQAFLDGAKEAVLQELREKKVRPCMGARVCACFCVCVCFHVCVCVFFSIAIGNR